MTVFDELTVGTPALTLSGFPRGRFAGWARARPAGCAALVALLACWGALIAVHHSHALPIPQARAIAIVQRSPRTRRMLTSAHTNRVQVLPIDSTHDSVWFYSGARLRVAAIVAEPGFVQYTAASATQHVAYGSGIANEPIVLGVLSAVFVLMTAVWPLWQIRNLDVLVLTASTASIMLLNGALLARTVAFGALVLLYLGLRCAWVGFGRSRPRAAAVCLFDRLTAGWDGGQRVRVLRLLLIACGLALAMIGISSRGVVDVGWAVMEGATDILRGVVPYGHVAGVLHGDTYPVGSYLLYTPAAWFWPVQDAWDSADGSLFMAVAAVLGGALMVLRTVRREPPRQRLNDVDAGALRMAIAWLTFPALVVTVSTGSTDAVLAVLVLGVVVLWRRPAAASALAAAGAWFKLVPLAIIPLVLAPLRGRRLAAALAAAGMVSVGMLLPLLAAGGLGGVTAMFHAVGYQADRVSPQSVWSLTGSVPLQQLVQSATVAIVIAAAVRLRRDAALASDRTRLAAMSAAVMIGLQLSASYWTYMYLVWALPGVMLSLIWRTEGVA